VALSAKAMKKFKPSDIDQIKQLVSATVGADSSRGDQVAVMVRSFDDDPIVAVPFYESGGFAVAVRYGAALLGVLLVLLLGVRPLIKALKREPVAPGKDAQAERADGSPPPTVQQITDPRTGAIDADMLGRHVGIAQAIVDEKPQDAVLALRQMLAPQDSAAAA
jgi:flagellar M-ring protein FliF